MAPQSTEVCLEVFTTESALCPVAQGRRDEHQWILCVNALNKHRFEDVHANYETKNAFSYRIISVIFNSEK